MNQDGPEIERALRDELLDHTDLSHSQAYICAKKLLPMFQAAIASAEARAQLEEGQQWYTPMHHSDEKYREEWARERISTLNGLAAARTPDSMSATRKPAPSACGCRCSTGIDGSITKGRGKLDGFGFWEHPCTHESGAPRQPTASPARPEGVAHSTKSCFTPIYTQAQLNQLLEAMARRVVEEAQFDQRDLNAVMAKYLSGTGMTMRDLAHSLNEILGRKLSESKLAQLRKVL